MYRILITFLFFIALVSTASAAEPLIAPVYPNAVAFSADWPGWYLSKDSFEQVTAFYSAGKVSSRTTKVDNGKERKAFIQYMSAAEVHKYDPVGSAIGVHITANAPGRTGTLPETSLPVVGDIFGKLKLYVAQNVLSQEEYDELVHTYRHLATWYFPLSTKRDAPGKALPMDRVISEECGEGPEEKNAMHDMQALAMQAQALMQQGRQREALELMQQVGQSAQATHTRAAGPEGAAQWRACLEKLASNGYPTRIEIALHPGHSADGK